MSFGFTVRRIRFSSLARAVVFIACLAGLIFPVTASAFPRLRCQFSQEGVVQVLDFMPAEDPYQAKAVELGESFRFKAVMIGDGQKIDYIKLYTYYRTRRQAVLLHEAKYRAPVAQAAPEPAALTGTNYLYSPDLGRELEYACALFEVAA